MNKLGQETTNWKVFYFPAIRKTMLLALRYKNISLQRSFQKKNIPPK